VTRWPGIGPCLSDKSQFRVTGIDLLGDDGNLEQRIDIIEEQV